MIRERLLILARGTARDVFWGEYDRDDTTCIACGDDGPLEVHHRDGDPLNNLLVNLVAVCHPCHVAEHRRRGTTGRLDEWKDLGIDLGGAPA